MGLNYNHLLYFYTAVNSGSLKLAAQNLDLSPSTVSEQIGELETYFGKNLLHRQKGKFGLTTHGYTAYQFARTIFTAGDRLKLTLRGKADVAGAPIEIGVNNSVTELFERNLFLPLFKSEETKIRLRVGELNSLTEDLFSFSLDVVITDRELKESKGVKCEVIQEPSYSIVVSPELKLKKTATLVELKKIPFIHYTAYSGVKWEIDQFFLKNAFKPDLIGEVDDTGIMKHAVLDGLCFAILPTAIVDKEIRAGHLQSLGIVDDVAVKVYAYYHHRDSSKQIRAVLDHLRASAREED